MTIKFFWSLLGMVNFQRPVRYIVPGTPYTSVESMLSMSLYCIYCIKYIQNTAHSQLTVATQVT